MRRYVLCGWASLLLVTASGCTTWSAQEYDARLESAENNAATARLRADQVCYRIDLVEQMIRSAAGEKLSIKQSDVKLTGWIFGMGYDDALLGRHPTREDLDMVSTMVPVMATHISGHFAAVNTLGLKMIGYDAGTPNPEGGVIRREADGKTPIRTEQLVHRRRQHDRVAARHAAHLQLLVAIHDQQLDRAEVGEDSPGVEGAFLSGQDRSAPHDDLGHCRPARDESRQCLPLFRGQEWPDRSRPEWLAPGDRAASAGYCRWA